MIRVKREMERKKRNKERVLYVRERERDGDEIPAAFALSVTSLCRLSWPNLTSCLNKSTSFDEEGEREFRLGMCLVGTHWKW